MTAIVMYPPYFKWPYTRTVVLYVLCSTCTSEIRFRGILAFSGDYFYTYIRFAKCDIFLVSMNPILKSTYSEMAAKIQHLAKTESLLIFVEQKLSSSPMHTDKLARLCGMAIKLIETHSNSFQRHSQKVWYCWYQISHLIGLGSRLMIEFPRI